MNKFLRLLAGLLGIFLLAVFFKGIDFNERTIMETIMNAFLALMGLGLFLPESRIGKFVPAKIHAIYIFAFSTLSLVTQSIVMLSNGSTIGSMFIVLGCIYPLALYCGFIILKQKGFNKCQQQDC